MITRGRRGRLSLNVRDLPTGTARTKKTRARTPPSDVEADGSSSFRKPKGTEGRRKDGRTEGGRGQSRRGQIVESRDVGRIRNDALFLPPLGNCGGGGEVDRRSPMRSLSILSPLHVRSTRSIAAAAAAPLLSVRARASVCGLRCSLCFWVLCCPTERWRPGSASLAVLLLSSLRHRLPPFFLLLFLSVFGCLLRSFALVANGRSLLVPRRFQTSRLVNPAERGNVKP